MEVAGSGYGPVAGSCEHDNETSCWTFVQLSDYQLLKKDSVPCHFYLIVNNILNCYCLKATYKPMCQETQKGTG
jgi:hypothetical protein